MGPARDAVDVADRSARAASVRIRELHEAAELRQISELCTGIWEADPADPPITTAIMRALAHSGNYVAGAFSEHRLVGASVAFLAAPAGRALHSHVTGVASEVRGRSVGFALEVHQRAWALQRGLETVSWIFDPLVARNAPRQPRQARRRAGRVPAGLLRDHGRRDQRRRPDGPTARHLAAGCTAGGPVLPWRAP